MGTEETLKWIPNYCVATVVDDDDDDDDVARSAYCDLADASVCTFACPRVDEHSGVVDAEPGRVAD
jgi:hypothetical protein